MAPPRARRFRVGDLDALDDVALQVFLQAGPAGVDPRRLGIAATTVAPALAERLLLALPAASRGRFREGYDLTADAATKDRACRHVVGRLFWPLLYWRDPGAYEELVAGELIHPAVVERLSLSGTVVCDVGAGAGRLTVIAAPVARQVIAVDAVPPLLARLEERLRDAGLTNVETRRGSFTALPLADASVDTVVACSSVTSRAPSGGDAALAEMERIVRPGGQVAVVWPDRPDWFRRRGFSHVAFEGNATLHLGDPATAERICADFYSAAAARWVARNKVADVPYAVLGVAPPNHVCLRRVPERR